MKDPHVVSLTYKASPSESISFEKAPPLDGTIENLRFRLDGETLRIEPTIHFPSIDEARYYVDPLLHSWEIDIALRFGKPELSFVYDTAKVIDRQPHHPGLRQAVLNVQLGELVLAGSAVTLRVSRGSYPHPPTVFRVNPDVETLWRRYQGYRKGREPLPSMAYFCLTLIESLAGGRDGAASAFKISKRVLAKIGQLTSERGDASTARKYRAITAGAALTGAESAWLEEAIKILIRRVGEARAIDTLSTVDIDNLPRL